MKRRLDGTGKARCAAGLVGLALLMLSGGLAVCGRAQAPAQEPAKATTPAAAPAPGTASAPAPVADKPAGADADKTAAPAASAMPAPQLTPQQKELAEDTAKLLELANELKAEMDKSTKDTLSLNVVKKADQIERLARKVRAEMKASIGN